MATSQETELRVITDLIDKQFERVETLFREGEITEDTYQKLTLSLINKLNILSVEEVMQEDDGAGNQTPVAKNQFPIVLGE